MVARVLLAASLCLLAGAAQAALPFDPHRDWQTLESVHFRVHFHGDGEGLARRVAAIAERVHLDATDALDWTPQGRTEIVLVDDTDLPQAYATPLPFNMIGLFVVPPEPGSSLQVDSVEQWLETVIAHEYTHIVHGDKVAGLPARLRRVFGRNALTFPHVYQPLWLIEGLAAHFETDVHAQVGRGQSAHTAMLMRTEVAAGLRPLAQVNLPNRSWPAGQVPYVYGVMFHQFLEEAYGPERIRHFIEEYASHTTPFRLSSATREAFGRDLPILWSEFEAWLHALYGPELGALRRLGVRDGVPLTEPGSVARHHGGNVQALADGSVWYVADDGTHRPRLMRLDADGRTERIARVHHGARFSVHPDAGVMIAQPEHCDERRVYYDLFLLRPGATRPERLTRCSRYRDVAWHPDGESLAAVRFEQGRSRIDLISARGAHLQTLAEADGEGIVAQPHWSPDGEHLVVVRARRGAGADLYELTVADGRWRPLTDDPNFPIRPRYTMEGTHILFSSDHGGMYDLRRLDRATGAVDSLTRVRTGAFEPSDGPDGVYFLLYGQDGYELRHIAHGPAVEPLPAPRQAPARPRELGVDPAAEPRPYSAFDTVWPTAWAPYLRLDTRITEVGTVLFGRDALGIHNWLLFPGVDTRRGRVVGTASYTWSDRVNATLGRTQSPESGRVVETDTATLGWRIPFSGIERSWNHFVGTGFERERDVELAAGVPPRAAARDHVAGVATVFDNARPSRLSVSRQEGRHVRLVAERSVGGSDFSGSVLTVDWREFVHLGEGRVLALRYAHGSGGPRTRPFVLGGAGTEAIPLLFSDQHGLFNKRRYSLRGYDTVPALAGEAMHLVAAEYRFPVRLVERSPHPLGLERWHAAVFAESGGAAGRNDTVRLHPAVGVEAMFDLAVGYRFGGLRLRVGYAHGFDDEAGGSDRVYLGFGSAF